MLELSTERERERERERDKELNKTLSYMFPFNRTTFAVLESLDPAFVEYVSLNS